MKDRGKIIPPSEENPYHRRVNRVGGKIVDASGWRSEYNWKYVIVDDPKINAAMCPGGRLIIYTGILNFAKSDDELASVIGHEVAHAMARHGAERFSQVTAYKFTAAALNAALASSKYQGAVSAAFGLGAQFGVLLPYSRLHEKEADYIGLLVMAKAGYDPQGAIELWESMEAQPHKNQIEFLSTHPSYGTRITNLRQWLPQALAYRQNPLKPLLAKRIDQTASLESNYQQEESSVITPPKSEPPSTTSSEGGSPQQGSSLSDAKLQDYYSMLWPQIKKNWHFSKNTLKWKSEFEATIVVVIEREGNVQRAWFEKKSGNALFDEVAMQAIKRAGPFPPIPKELNNDTLKVGIRFYPE